MKPADARKSPAPGFLFFHLFIILGFSLLSVPLFSNKIEAAGSCPIDMVLVTGGAFQYGTPDNKLIKIMQLCNRSIGNCYEEWFQGENINRPSPLLNIYPYCIDYYEYPNKKGEPPLRGVTWSEAHNYCMEKGKRLCTDMEWEKACAGTAGLSWPFGEKYQEKNCNINTPRLEPSGKRPACRSVFGVFDMTGNVAEWTASIPDKDNSPTFKYAPLDDRETPRIVKGGSYHDHPLFTRCAFKDETPPSYKYDTLGFRCCKDLEGK